MSTPRVFGSLMLTLLVLLWGWHYVGTNPYAWQFIGVSTASMAGAWALIWLVGLVRCGSWKSWWRS